MTQFISETKFYEAVYIAREVRNIIEDAFGNSLFMSEFYGNGIYEPLGERTTLHLFIEFVADDIIRAAAYETDLEQNKSTLFSETGEILNNPVRTPIDEAFDFYDLEYIAFEDWLRESDRDTLFGIDTGDIEAYIEDLTLTGDLSVLYGKISGEVFPILSKDRLLIAAFDEMTVKHLIEVESEGPDD